MKLLIDTSNRTQNPWLKSPVSFPQGSGPETPAGPRDKGRPGQVEKIVHCPVWCWKFSKTEKMLIEAKLSYRWSSGVFMKKIDKKKKPGEKEKK